MNLMDFIGHLRRRTRNFEESLTDKESFFQSRREIIELLDASLTELSKKQKEFESAHQEMVKLKKEKDHYQNLYQKETTRKADRTPWELKLLNLVLKSKFLLNAASYGGVAPMTKQDRLSIQTWMKETHEVLAEGDNSLKGSRG